MLARVHTTYKLEWTWERDDGKCGSDSEYCYSEVDAHHLLDQLEKNEHRKITSAFLTTIERLI